MIAARGRLGIALNDSVRAQEAYAALTPHGDLLVGGGSASVPVGPVAQALGELAEHFGRSAEAAERYRQAVTIAVRAGAPRWAAEAHASLRRLPRGRLALNNH